MNQADQHRKDHPIRNVALVGLRDGEGNIMLIRNRKLADWWQPLGGGVEPEDPTPQAAAVRELQEEVGLMIEQSDLTSVLETPYDFGEGTVYFYELHVDREQLHLHFNEREIIEHQWFLPAEAQSLAAFPGTKSYLRTLV